MASSSPSPTDFSVVVDKQPDPETIYEKDPMDDVEPAVVDHYWDGGKVPVFKPTMEEFKDFARYMKAVHPHGMKSGICKIIPPAEWVAANPPLDDKVKSIRVKNPIEQQIAGSNGEYSQVNFVKQRSYNLPQWRQLCEASEHQPPARRGERRLNQNARGQTESAKQQRARRAKKKLEEEQAMRTPVPEVKEEEIDTVMTDNPAHPPTPAKSPKREHHLETPEPSQLDSKGRQPRARRSTRRSRKVEPEDDGLFEGFDYRLANPEDFTPERCAELEKHYWKSLTFNSPLYGADMPGSLFDERTTCWNVAQLPNILDCLGKKIPGVNTAYLYCGMWKSTFAWHLEDVDLYSINYIHFGAPKQWYSISQEDAPRFESVMKAIWPNEAKKCDQFLRHKTFLVSPSLLAQRGIKVNRLVHYEHEFVITFPYGYHSGYNLGYNCAESVNFATEAWLEYGRIAKKCECIDDAVWVDVREVERKLRGEPTDSESESTDEDEDEDQEKSLGHPLSPPDSIDGPPSKRRKRDRRGPRFFKRGDEPVCLYKSPCCLCPNDFKHETLLETEDGLKAHRVCALYTDEVSLKDDNESGKEIVCNINKVTKARLNLKCTYCRLTKGSCFQCSEPSCVRAYHATCAALAGVAVQYLDSVSYAEDGTELFEVKPHFKCKFHRTKRTKDATVEQLEADSTITTYAQSLEKNEVVQAQYLKDFNGGTDIFAGVVLENRKSEHTVVIEVIPEGLVRSCIL
ncbi:JmjC-domain-containing protein [Ascobolus immersus RN42]|uniref:[histone H3]-trimethyl-L-lysine(9) demethylase n=1 Tax=Ascobolus immersus RN42 TaxID=1160509 RepID=A0A3N4IFA8_ASCIM|nr:JmjC-domain-containing protein [Ascobolus immersus RN42]